MCLAVPVKLEEVMDGMVGRVRLSGITRSVDLTLVEDPQPGDYVLVHAGFAIEKINAEEAEKTLEIFREILSMDDLTEEDT